MLIQFIEELKGRSQSTAALGVKLLISHAHLNIEIQLGERLKFPIDLAEGAC